jgi:STIP1 homology and U-box containing protein 1
MSGAAEAEALKAQANAAYGRGKYAAAVGLYTDALLALGRAPPAPLVPLLSTLHSNRALAHQKLGDWAGVEADAAAAVAADRFNAKGHYLLGLAHLNAARWERGLDALRKGLDKAARKAAPGPGGGGGGSDTLVREFEAAIARGRAAAAEAAAAAARASDADLHAFLQAAVRAHAAALPPSPPLQAPGGHDGGGGVPPAVSDDVVALRLAQLRAVFDERDAARGGAVSSSGSAHARDDAPEHLTCPITFEVMTEPVVTPSGTSYQRAAIEAYVDRRGEDPVSRQPLARSQLVPNHGLRAAVAAYLEAHPWAHPALPFASPVYGELAAAAAAAAGAANGPSSPLQPTPDSAPAPNGEAGGR